MPYADANKEKILELPFSRSSHKYNRILEYVWFVALIHIEVHIDGQNAILEFSIPI
jgi:hypothetical protein